MPRSSSRSSSSSRSGGGGMFGGGSKPAASRSAAPARQQSTHAAPQHHAPAPVAAPAAHPPAPMMSSGAQGGGFMSTMMSGLAFGTGSAIAHRAVGAIAGSLTGGSSDPASAAVVEQAVQEPVKNECSSFQQDFIKCLQLNSADISMCQMKLESLNQCKQAFQ